MKQTLYTIVNQDDRFVYLDLGSVKYDDKLPRRSMTADSIEKIEKKLAQARKAKEQDNKWYAEQVSKWDKRHKDYKIVQENLRKKRAYKFRIIKICIEEIS